MKDMFESHTRGLTSPAEGAEEVTPSNAALTNVTRAIYVGVDGNLSVEMASGVQVTLRSVRGGVVYPLRVCKILSNGTTAGNIVALW